MAEDDGLTYTLKLKDDATWSDGEPITTKDVEFTVDYYFNFVGGVAETLLSGYTLNVIDEKTVEFVRESFSGTFYDDLGSMRLYPSHVFNDDINAIDGSEYLSSDKIVTSGAFRLLEWNAGESFVFEVRDDYYGTKPGFDKLNMICMPEENTRKLAFENGEISYIELTTAEDIEKYSTDEYKLQESILGKVWHLQYNANCQNREGLSDDARKAVSLALDGQGIADTVFGNDKLAMASHSSFSVAEGFYNDEIERKQDIEAAKALAESSGLVDKTLTVIYNTGHSSAEQIGIVVQQQLAKAGIKVELQGYDGSAFYPRVFQNMLQAGEVESTDWDFAIGQESGMYGEAHSSHLFYANEPTLGPNAAELIIKASATIDTAEREKLYKEAQAANEEENYWIPLIEENSVIAAQNNITGLERYDISPLLFGYPMLGIE